MAVLSGLDLDLAATGSHFQIGVLSLLKWDQMNLGSLLQLAVASCTSFLPFGKEMAYGALLFHSPLFVKGLQGK